MAEAVFTHIVNQNGLTDRITHIDSFGTAGYHIGDRSDSRTIQTCKNHKIPINHRGQQIKSKHFTEFDYILCMDSSNLYNLKKIQPSNCNSIVEMFGEWRSSSKFDKIIDDPYYGGDDGFERCYLQCVDFSKNFIKKELGINID
ncbi:hypothetical protein C6P40_000900 [Pichia californica]|uniref:Phosphotyrosine protein phosphatase I domain-containing protein n=1 Tax=Pichia californica TaxID=460514 RepID=A0A9P7BFU2_9ASCO|nr:hypothetical protein C6P42_004819 [[Candida] californica]KAG0688490.1 hypothetical protein C6P40_000900 [[Candida] californica]